MASRNCVQVLAVFHSMAREVLAASTELAFVALSK